MQEAANSFIPEDRRADAHMCIGRLLVAHTPPEKPEEVIFEIVNQLNRGAPHHGSRAIEDLIDLPLMQDPESLATLDVLTALGPPTLYANGNLYALTSSRAVNLSLERGNSDAAPAHSAAACKPKFSAAKQ